MKNDNEYTRHAKRVTYRHLYNLKDSDPFWESVSKTYTRQFAIVRAGNKHPDDCDANWINEWYASQRPFWGRGCCKLLRSINRQDKGANE